jgi:hypothetical protein
MQVKAKISCDHPQPRRKAGGSIRPEFQQPPKSMLSKLLTDMKITISGNIIIRCARARDLVEDTAVQM